jgi:hypothetical protein
MAYVDVVGVVVSEMEAFPQKFPVAPHLGENSAVAIAG